MHFDAEDVAKLAEVNGAFFAVLTAGREARITVPALTLPYYLR